MENTQSLEILDTLLTQSPFGSSDYIRAQRQVAYKRRLGKIAPRMPAAGQLVEALDKAPAYSQYRTLGDTVLRCAVQHALRQLETGAPYGLPLDQCEEIFRATVVHLGREECRGPLEAGLDRGLRLGPQRHHGWIWSEEHLDDLFGRSFRYLVHDNYGAPLCTPNPDEIAMVRKGAQLLNELLPLLALSSLSHAHLVAVFPQAGTWLRKASSSQYRLSGTIFISRVLLQSPWWVAEHLFHEALHQQLYDFRHGHSLLALNAQREDTPRVCSLWNLPDLDKSNYWDVHRALAAFHVYVHLALLCKLAEQRAPALKEVYGPLDGSVAMTGSRKALTRAYYLAEQIKGVCWEEMGPAGKRLVDWLISILDTMEPSPPPQGAHVHLLLERYMREAREVDFLVSNTEKGAELKKYLSDVIRKEVDMAYNIFSNMNASIDLGLFNGQLGPEEEWGLEFGRIRSLVTKTLLSCSSDGYRLPERLPESGRPDEMAREMVEASSERLKFLLSQQRQPASEILGVG
jgi:hypothetical protein